LRSRRGLVFVAICGVSLAVAAAAVAFAALGARTDEPRAETAPGAEPQVLFRSRDGSVAATNGRVAAVPLARPDGPRKTLGRLCERSYFTRDRGLCLAPKGDFLLTFEAQVLGPDARVVHELRLRGFPSRARISPDGRLGAATTFVQGHSYAAEGAFSTRTVLIDMERGTELAELEQFTVVRDGERIRSPDFNFWGVTFARDSNRFYATLATGGSTYLVEGDARARTATVLHENVECPSLSPDGTRIAYKKLVGGPGEWRIHVLDLETMTETPLAETRVVDDQVEWLDDRNVLYGIERAIWTARADGSGTPRVFIADADSPAVLH
jgi:hypothetical protein